MLPSSLFAYSIIPLESAFASFAKKLELVRLYILSILREIFKRINNKILASVLQGACFPFNYLDKINMI